MRLWCVLVLAACPAPVAAPPVAPAKPQSASSPEPTPPVVVPDTSAAAHAVIDQALVAKGGRERLVAMTALRERGSGAGTSYSMVRFEKLIVPPDKLSESFTRRTQSGHNGWVRLYLLESHAWVHAYSDQLLENEQHGLESANADALKLDVWRDIDFVLLRAAEPGAKLATAPDATVAGRPCNVVTVIGPDGTPVGLYLDKETHLLVGETFDGLAIEVDHFEEIDGIVFARHRTEIRGEHDRLELVYEIDAKPKWDIGSFSPR